MNFQEKIYKLRKACDVNAENITKIIENFLPLQAHFINDEISTDLNCYIPSEANFQLPNVFLKTNLTSACKKYMEKNVERNDYEEVIDFTIKKLEMFFSDNDTDLLENEVEVSLDLINTLYKSRYGF